MGIKREKETKHVRCPGLAAVSLMLGLFLLSACGRESDKEWSSESGSESGNEFGKEFGRESGSEFDNDFGNESGQYVISGEEDLVVRILCEEKSGSGVIYTASDGQIYVITAAHVLGGQENICIRFAGKEAAAGTLLPVSTEDCVFVAGLDLAFLRFAGEVLDERSLPASTGAGITAEEDAAQVVRLLGYDQAGALQSMDAVLVEDWIYLEDFQNYMMLLAGEALPGMSGGGVFSEEGLLLGIICGEDAEGHIAVLTEDVIQAEFLVMCR